MLPLPHENTDTEAQVRAWEEELRRQEEAGRKLLEEKEKARREKREPEYAI